MDNQRDSLEDVRMVAGEMLVGWDMGQWLLKDAVEQDEAPLEKMSHMDNDFREKVPNGDHLQGYSFLVDLDLVPTHPSVSDVVVDDDVVVERRQHRSD